MYFSWILPVIPVLLLFLLPLIICKIQKIAQNNRWIMLINLGFVATLAIICIKGIIQFPLIQDRYNTILLAAWVSVYIVYLLLLPFIVFKSPDEQTFLIRIFPLAFIVAAHGTYLTHHIVGSSYGLWPILIITIAVIISVLQKELPHIYISPITGIFVAVTLYALVINYQFLIIYQYIYSPGNTYQLTNPRLYGAGTPGIWMRELDNLLVYTAKYIPPNDLVVTVPGEDPFYAATGRRNPLPDISFHKEVYPVYAADFPKYFAQNKVQWVIAKTKTQLPWQFGYIDLTRPEYGLTRYYDKLAPVGIYEIYKRNSNP
jgi:hypothetical protein